MILAHDQSGSHTHTHSLRRSGRSVDLYKRRRRHPMKAAIGQGWAMLVIASLPLFMSLTPILVTATHHVPHPHQHLRRGHEEAVQRAVASAASASASSTHAGGQWLAWSGPSSVGKVGVEAMAVTSIATSPVQHTGVTAYNAAGATPPKSTGSTPGTTSGSVKAPDPPLKPIIALAQGGSSDKIANEWVGAHNAARKQYGAKDLTWSADLVPKAQANAKPCTHGHT